MRIMQMKSVAAAGVALLALAGPAEAYVGPGAGITMLGALWAVIAAVVLAVGGLLLWPLRRMLGRNKPTPANVADAAAEPDAPTEPSR